MVSIKFIILPLHALTYIAAHDVTIFRNQGPREEVCGESEMQHIFFAVPRTKFQTQAGEVV